jgi:hypothetical protein
VDPGDEEWRSAGPAAVHGRGDLTSHCSRDHRDADAGYRMVRLPDGRLARVPPDGEQFGPAVRDPGSRGP